MYKYYYVYIISNISNTVIYIGITNNLERRLYEHKCQINNSFTKRYRIKKLLYYEVYSSITDAIAREKALKVWKRKWKINLIKSKNPSLLDLSSDSGQVVRPIV